MSAKIEANLFCMSILMHVSSLNKNKKKWRSAAVKIYCSWAFANVLIGKYKKKSSASSHRVIINIVKDYSGFYNVDQASPTKLVKEKNINQVDELGGVKGIANSLDVNLCHGIKGDDHEDSLRIIGAFYGNSRN